MTARRPLRIGILGVARIGGEGIALPARALGHRLVAVASRDRSRAEFFAELCGVERVADSYAQVLGAPDIDVVYIPQVPACHERWTLAAIGAGKHVLCEKPLGTSAGQADRIRTAARRAGVHVHEAHHHLCHPLWGLLHGYLGPQARRTGPLGDLVSVRADLAMRPPDADDPRWSPRLGGGVLLDLGCYGLQVLRMLSGYGGGTPTVAAASAATVAPAGDRARASGRAGASRVDTDAHVRLRYPLGAQAAVRASMTASETQHRLTVTGTRGRLTVDGFVLPHLGGTVALERGAPDGRGRIAEPVPGAAELFSAPTTYTHQLARFADLVRRGDPMPWGWSLDDSAAVARTLDAVRAAAGLPSP